MDENSCVKIKFAVLKFFFVSRSVDETLTNLYILIFVGRYCYNLQDENPRNAPVSGVRKMWTKTLASR